MDDHYDIKTLLQSATCHGSTVRGHGRQGCVARTEHPVSNTGRLDAVVQAIQNVLRKQQAKGALSLEYLPNDGEAGRTGDDIRFKHLRDQGRSLQDRLRHGLASLSIAEQCKNRRTLQQLLKARNLPPEKIYDHALRTGQKLLLLKDMMEDMDLYGLLFFAGSALWHAPNQKLKVLVKGLGSEKTLKELSRENKGWFSKARKYYDEEVILVPGRSAQMVYQNKDLLPPDLVQVVFVPVTRTLTSLLHWRPESNPDVVQSRSGFIEHTSEAVYTDTGCLESSTSASQPVVNDIGASPLHVLLSCPSLVSVGA